jgi:hypothetical protein
MAGVVRVIRAGTPVDMGPRLGPQAHERDGLVLDYFLGFLGFLGTAWLSAGSGMLDTVQALIEQGDVDPEAIRQLDWGLWELTPFYCPDCQLNKISAVYHSRCQSRAEADANVCSNPALWPAVRSPCICRYREAAIPPG